MIEKPARVNSLNVVLAFSTGTRSPQRRGFGNCSVFSSSEVSEVPKVQQAGTEGKRPSYPTTDQVLRRGGRLKNSLGSLLLFDNSAKGSYRNFSHSGKFLFALIFDGDRRRSIELPVDAEGGIVPRRR
jgi:hypothetical protein